MKSKLKLILILVTFISSSQSKKVTIIGNLPQQHGGEYISFSKPLGKYSIIWRNIDESDNATIKDNRLFKRIDLQVPGIICIYEKPFNGQISTRFYAEPGDTIFIERINNEIIFSGRNAPINKLHSDIKIALPEFNDAVYDFLKEGKNAKEIISKISDVEKKYFNQYSEFFIKKQISKRCLDYTKMMMEHCIDNMVLNFAIDENIRKELESTLKKDEADKVVEFFIAKYSDYNQENLTSPFFWSLIGKKATHLEKQASIKNIKIDRFWNQFDNVFPFPMNNFGIIDYLESNEYKEVYIGDFLLNLLIKKEKAKKINYKNLVDIYNAFSEKFPNSVYLAPISKNMIEISLENVNNNANSTVKIETTIKLDNLAHFGIKLEQENTPFAKSDQSLTDALSIKFPNQDIFIDLWATWCGPCIKQFSYNKDLHVFLESKSIKTLYISEDKEEDLLKWEKYINDYNLVGYHFLANKKYQEKFLNPLTEFLPRYFLYKSKTKELIPLEGFPSEKDKFYQNITKALYTK